jgi:hypothetical protein
MYALAAGIGLLLVLGLGPDRRDTAVSVYLAALTALLVLTAARRIGRALPPAPPLLDRPPSTLRPVSQRKPAQLAWVESRLSRGYGSADGASRHFRPLLLQVVSAELARKHGVVLERQPERAAELLGPRLRMLLDTAGGEIGAPLSPGELLQIVEELEGL